MAVTAEQAKKELLRRGAISELEKRRQATQIAPGSSPTQPPPTQPQQAFQPQAAEPAQSVQTETRSVFHPPDPAQNLKPISELTPKQRQDLQSKAADTIEGTKKALSGIKPFTAFGMRERLEKGDFVGDKTIRKGVIGRKWTDPELENAKAIVKQFPNQFTTDEKTALGRAEAALHPWRALPGQIKTVITKGISTPFGWGEFLAPGLQAELSQELKEIPGIAGAPLAEAAAGGIDAYVKWVHVFPALFKAIGFTGKIPFLQKGTQALKKATGFTKLEKVIPRTSKAITSSLGAFGKGAGVGATYSGVTAFNNGLSWEQAKPLIIQDAITMGSIAVAFNVAGSIDTAVYAKRLRTAMIKASNAKYTRLFAETKTQPPSASRTAAVKSLVGQKKLDLQAIDSIVSDVEGSLIGIKKGKLFQKGQKGIDSPTEMARKFMETGQRPVVRPTGTEPLKKGLGKTAKKPLLPTTRAGEIAETTRDIAKMIRQPVRAAEKIRATQPPPSVKQVTPTPITKKIEPQAVEPTFEEWQKEQAPSYVKETNAEFHGTLKNQKLHYRSKIADIRRRAEPQAVEGEIIDVVRYHNAKNVLSDDIRGGTWYSVGKEGERYENVDKKIELGGKTKLETQIETKKPFYIKNASRHKTLLDDSADLPFLSAETKESLLNLRHSKTKKELFEEAKILALSEKIIAKLKKKHLFTAQQAIADNVISKEMAKQGYDALLRVDEKDNILEIFKPAPPVTKPPKKGIIPQAIDDWNAGKLYIDNAGNWRLRKEGKSKGPIAPYNKELKPHVSPETLESMAKDERKQVELRGSIGAARPGGQDASLKRAQKIAAKTKQDVFVQQNAAGKFITRKIRPPKGFFTIVTPSGKATFIKQADVTAEDAFDFGEKIRGPKLTDKVAKLKHDIVQKNADIKSLQKELQNLIQTSLPKSTEREQALKLLLRIRPEQQVKTNLKNFGAAIVKVGDLADQVRKSQAISGLKKTEKELKKKFGLRKNKIGKLRPEFQQKVGKLLEGIDLAKLSSRKTKDLLSLQRKLNQLASNIANASLDLNEVDQALKNDDIVELTKIPTSRIQQLRRLAKTPVRSMTAQDIEDLNNALNSLVKQNELKNKILSGKTTIELSTALGSMTKEIIPTKKAKRGIIKRKSIFGKVFRTNASTIATFVNGATGGLNNTSGKYLFYDLMEGIDRERSALRDIQGKIQADMKKAGITPNDIEKWGRKTHTVKIRGKNFNLTERQLISILLDTRNQDNFKALQKGKRWMDGNRLFRTGPLSFDNIADLVAPLTAKHKAFANIVNDVLDNTTAPAMNEASMRTENYEKFTVKKYWPIRRTLPRSLGGAKAHIVPLSEKGFTKERTGGNQPSWLVDVLSEFKHSIDESVAYSNLLIPLFNAKSVLSSTYWQNSMERAGRLDEMAGIIEAIQRLEGTITDRDALDIVAGTILRGYSRKALGFNLSSYVAQLTSEPLLSVTDPVEYVKHRVSFSKSLQDEINKNSGYLWFRKEGVRVTREIGDVAASGSTQQFFTGKNPLINKPMSGLGFFDNAVMQKLWKMAKGHVNNKTNLTKGSEEYWKAVRKREFELIVSQPNWHPFLRSRQLNSTNPFKRAFFMFRSAREAMHNMVLRANDGLANKVPGAKKKWIGTMAAVAMSIMLYRIMKEMYWRGTKKLPVWLGLKDEPTKEEAADTIFNVSEKILYDFVGLAPLGDFIKPIVSTPIKVVREKPIYRFAPGTPITDTAEVLSKDVVFNATKAAKKAAEGEEWQQDAQKTALGITELLSALLGLPFVGVKTLAGPTIKELLAEDEATGI